MDFYKEELLDHYKNPKNNKTMENPEIDSLENNPSCGDSIRIQASVINDKLNVIMFTGQGCVISQATASMLTQACVGKTLHEVLHLNSNFILDLIGISLGPNRLKCALLPLQALQNGIKQYLINKKAS